MCLAKHLGPVWEVFGALWPLFLYQVQVLNRQEGTLYQYSAELFAVEFVDLGGSLAC